MQLFFATYSVATASAVALYEAGIEFEPVFVDFAKGEQKSDAFLAVNPKGRVPALKSDAGILTETGAILEYIADLAPNASLIPNDPWQAAQMRAAMYYFASTAHVNHAHKLRGARWADQESSFQDMRAKVPQTMTETCAYIEDNLLLGRFVMGDVLTLADPYLFTICTWLKGDGVDIAQFPKLTAFIETMRARPSVQAAQKHRFFPEDCL